ncbi:unnamed protein product [Paramecium pentaurelia]|uniref:Uncharacterized protein n=1 Tax=Paramecium pentaurelia TaxID=43138 RepID=A0A8S1WI60_9CILI|nr:unnamed protein product [Paramecium pentaurelia]
MDQIDIETINLQAKKAKELFNEGKHNEADARSYVISIKLLQK